MGFNLEKARAAGKTDSQIAEYLSSVSGFNISKARADGKTDSQIAEYLSTRSRPAESDQTSIDDKTGAGWKERFAIGSATSNADKLARARAFYGDSARMEPDERISFINPDTGRRTYVNPSGLDWGDVAGTGREIVSTVASIPAAIAGAVGGGGVNLVTGSLAGSAAGAAAGQATDAWAAEMAREAARERGNTVPDIQPAKDAIKDAAIETALGTVGGTTLGAVGRGLSSAFNPMKQEVVQAFKNLGIDIPTVGTAVNSKASAMYENALGGLLGGSRAMENANLAGATGLKKAIDKTADNMGGVPINTPGELGVALHAAADRSKTAFKNANKAFYDDFNERWGASPATLENTRAIIDRITAGLSPEVRAQIQGRLNALLRAELVDEGAGTLNASTIKAARTRLGEMLERPAAMDTSSIQQGELRKLYGALSDDYRAAITDTGAKEALVKHNQWEAAQHRAREILDRNLLGKRSAQQSGESLLRADLSPETVEAMRYTLSPSDFASMRGGILRNSARPLASEGLPEEAASATQLSKMLGNGRGGFSPETQSTLWGDDVADLRIVADAIANSARNANTSRTAQQSAMMDMLKYPARLFQVGSFLNPSTAAAGAASVAVPWAGAKATTSPSIIKYLAKPQSRLSKYTFEDLFPTVGRIGGLLGQFAQ